MKKLIFICFALISICSAGAVRTQTVTSPDGRLSATVRVGDEITYSVNVDGTALITPSVISMTLEDGSSYGKGSKLLKVQKSSSDKILKPVVYRKSEIQDNYNAITLCFKAFNLEFRAYDEGIAWRFISLSKTPFKVSGEEANFSFTDNWESVVPYVRGKGSFTNQFNNSFENSYSVFNLSDWDKERLAFSPIVVKAGSYRVAIAESDLMNYPGMYLYRGQKDNSLSGVFAPFPTGEYAKPGNFKNGYVSGAEKWIATYEKGESFPWRIVVVAREDRELADCDMVYRLATPAADTDWSWVKPGHSAWDWWCGWNLSGVDFEAGVNNETYKYYIDFAAEYKLEYILIDAGWYTDGDMYKIKEGLDLPMLVEYGKSKGVGLWLWGGYWPFHNDIEGLCKLYSQMGIKGFKIDFMDRDDQAMVQFYTNAATIGARYHMMFDFHGAYKPTGNVRTFPNVLEHEGINGLENVKWSSLQKFDMMTYDVTLPFTRFLAGPADYTQGAMRNATKDNFRPVNSEPMSQGTRCHQMAQYVVFDSPFVMLCDAPSMYYRNEECTRFISSVPVVWDETEVLAGEIGEYILTAKRSGEDWYLGALTNWTGRDLEIDFGFLPAGSYRMEFFRDGVNAERAASDWACGSMDVKPSDKVKIHLASGGGWTARISRL